MSTSIDSESIPSRAPSRASVGFPRASRTPTEVARVWPVGAAWSASTEAGDEGPSKLKHLNRGGHQNHEGERAPWFLDVVSP